MADKKSFVMYKSWKELFNSLPKEMAGELIQAVFCYQDGEEVHIDNPALSAIFNYLINTKEEQVSQGRETAEYRKFRKSVLERDKYICQHCGCTNNLHVHHILPYAYYPEERINVDNGITLCKRCHYKEHRK